MHDFCSLALLNQQVSLRWLRLPQLLSLLGAANLYLLLCAGLTLVRATLYQETWPFSILQSGKSCNYKWSTLPIRGMSFEIKHILLIGTYFLPMEMHLVTSTTVFSWMIKVCDDSHCMTWKVSPTHSWQQPIYINKGSHCQLSLITGCNESLLAAAVFVFRSQYVVCIHRSIHVEELCIIVVMVMMTRVLGGKEKVSTSGPEAFEPLLRC